MICIFLNTPSVIVAQPTSMSQVRDYWHDILSSIHDSQDFPKCVPIIGEGASTPWIRSTSDIASKWANDYGYPYRKYTNYLIIEQG
jgi:hypothetical protein